MANTNKKLLTVAILAIAFFFFMVYLVSDRHGDALLLETPKIINPTAPAEIAICIVYDASGSMGDQVVGKRGSQPKYVIANRALIAVIDILQKYVDSGSKEVDHSVYAGLVTFEGVSCSVMPFNGAKIKQMLTQFTQPAGGTPLGEAIYKAGRELLNINARHKHILVLTDGKNTRGADPAVVIPELKKEAQSNGSIVDVHIIGFDVQDKIFAPLQSQGVNVFSAVDEKELTMQLELLLRKKILLEDDEITASLTPLK